jgi:hypothetical protein
MTENPDTFFMTEHYRESPLVLVNLLSVHDAELRELVEAAWRLLASPKLLAKKNSSKT